MESIVMGKETAYRRLRGDVPFTFSEACIIAQKLGISLDNLAEIERPKRPVFELELSPDNIGDYLEQKLLQYEVSYESFINIDNIKMHTACNTIPFSYICGYENLFKLFSFKIKYQLRDDGRTHKFNEVQLSEDINRRRKELAKRYMLLSNIYIVIDRNIFVYFINEIKYFFTLGLISEEEKENIKRELYELMSDMEYVSDSGKNRSGHTSLLYLSNVDFNSNYTYIYGDNFERAYMDAIYLLDTISSSDPQICYIHKTWIESLKRYSTLITVSGERDRRLYFDEQKELILGI